MKVPPWAGFVADFPEDQVEGGGDIKVFGGRNVALALGQIFADLGCSRISDPWSAGEMGWEFDFDYGAGHGFWCRVQSFHPVFWLLFENRSDSPDGAAAYVELWRKFGNALERDRRFQKVLWRSSKEGPPDWDEVEGTSDPPEQTFAEMFTLAEFEQYDPKPGCLSFLIGVPLMFFGAGFTIDYIFFFKTLDRWELVRANVFIFSLGFVIFFWSKIRWWIDNLRARSARR